MSYKHFSITKLVILEAFGNQSHPRDTETWRQQREAVEVVGVNGDNVTSAGYEELMKGVRACTTGALPWLSPPPPHPQPKIPAAESRWSTNPHSSHYHPQLKPSFLHPFSALPKSGGADHRPCSPNTTKVLSSTILSASLRSRNNNKYINCCIDLNSKQLRDF